MWAWLKGLFRAPVERASPVDADAPTEPIEPVALPIESEIDLHTFSPKETRDVVDAYLHEARAVGFREVRVVHGRGKGVQRRIIRSLLEEHPAVESFRDAAPYSGGWGATVVVLRTDPAVTPE